MAEVGISREEMVELEPYAVEVRYSDDISWIAEADIRRAVDVAERVWNHVRHTVGSDTP